MSVNGTDGRVGHDPAPRVREDLWGTCVAQGVGQADRASQRRREGLPSRWNMGDDGGRTGAGMACPPAGLMPTRWRPWARWVHRWVGMVLGLWLALVSLTGSLVVFRGEIEAALHPGLTRVTPGPGRAVLEDIHARVRQAHPEAVFRTVNLPTTPTESVSWWGHDGQGRSFHVYANPYTGELLGVDVASGNVTEWLYLFHAQLLGGKRASK